MAGIFVVSDSNDKIKLWIIELFKVNKNASKIDFTIQILWFYSIIHSRSGIWQALTRQIRNK